MKDLGFFKTVLEEIGGDRPIGDVIEILHFKGFTIIETIKVLHQSYGLSLQESKDLVSCHKVWKDVLEDNKPLHDELCSDDFLDEAMRDNSQYKK